MAIFQTTVPVTLPSGELADFGFFGIGVDLASAVGAVDAWYVSLAGDTAFKGIYDSATTFGTGKVSEINEATGAVITSMAAGTAFSGTGIDSPLPPQVAVCVSVNTAIISARTRGRFYLPAPMVNQVTAAGRLSSGCQTAILEAMSAAFVIMNTNTLTLGVYSRTGRNIEPTTTIDVGDVYDTVRTRRDKLVELRVSAPGQ